MSSEKNLIPLASCQITQISGDKKTDWFIRDSHQKGLGTLPKILNEKQAMGIIHLARRFELNALNIGITFQQQKMNRVFNEERLKLQRVIKELQAHNEKLSEKLEKFIISEE